MTPVVLVTDHRHRSASTANSASILWSRYLRLDDHADAARRDSPGALHLLAESPVNRPAPQPRRSGFTRCLSLLLTARSPFGLWSPGDFVLAAFLAAARSCCKTMTPRLEVSLPNMAWVGSRDTKPRVVRVAGVGASAPSRFNCFAETRVNNALISALAVNMRRMTRGLRFVAPALRWCAPTQPPAGVFSPAGFSLPTGGAEVIVAETRGPTRQHDRLRALEPSRLSSNLAYVPAY
jgi:hypothetical protein